MDSGWRFHPGKACKVAAGFLIPVFLDRSLLKKYHCLQSVLKDSGMVAIAFSGGVDSSLLLAVGVDVLADRCLGFLGVSQLQARQEMNNALRFAGRLGARFKIVEFDPLGWPGFKANSKKRCYICKKMMYESFFSRMPSGSCLMDGTNCDDLRQDRPGLRAIKELGLKMPLVEAGLNKVEIRRISRALQLKTWDHFSSSCLATRICQNQLITPAKLALIEKAENFLCELGFGGCRVRLCDNFVVISLVPDDFEKMSRETTRQKVKEFFAAQSLIEVFLDLSERPGIVP